ncbi:alpha/beta hydrolase (plasmid) [Rhizobium sp. CC1099]|uniref:alpha/beta hydrolase n=1 Tax=Rhizobium sp. CC1099 TaxID=3039160 RepID=UPI0024B212C5|nr:alpha/beta hydrolase [Rhizobium sp. CC1099]WFU91341.1 alpha/beta hydrolase [Rhizobium sp. CC1099]
MNRLRYLFAGVACFLPVTVSSIASAAEAANEPYRQPACVGHVTPATPDVAKDPDLAPAVRDFLVKLNKNASPFWELPQPKPQDILTQIQDQTPVDMAGVTTTEVPITIDGREVNLFVMKPINPAPNPGVILFLHGGVWIVGNFENHKRLLRDIVVQSGQPAVFLQYTTLPEARYPVQIDQAYATLDWVTKHVSEIGGDPSRIAVVGNSVGGDMTAALSLMAKDKKGPKISYQVLLWPATDASVDTCSYLEYANDRFLSRDFMKYGWERYAPTEAERNNPYVSPLRASLDHLKDLPPALVITDQNDVLRDEGEAYGRRLQDAGVPTVSTRYEGTIHDFGLLNALADLPTTKTMISEVANGIREHIGN